MSICVRCKQPIENNGEAVIEYVSVKRKFYCSDICKRMAKRARDRKLKNPRKSPELQGRFFLYYLRIKLRDSTVYKVGHTTDIEFRVKSVCNQFKGHGEMIYSEEFTTLTEATEAERFTKRMGSRYTTNTKPYPTETFTRDVLGKDT